LLALNFNHHKDQDMLDKLFLWFDARITGFQLNEVMI